MHSCYHISLNMYSKLPRFCRILLSSTLEWDLHAVTNVILEVYWKFSPKSKGFWLAPHSSLCRSIVYVKQVILRNTFCGHTCEVLLVYWKYQITHSVIAQFMIILEYSFHTCILFHSETFIGPGINFPLDNNRLTRVK